MSDTGDSTTRIGIDASVTGADSVAGLTNNVVALSQQLVNLSQSATRSFSIQDSLNKALDRTRLSTGLVHNALAEYRKGQVLTNRVVEQATQQLNALSAAQAKVAASGKTMSPALSASYRQANSHLTSVVSSADALNRVLKTNAIEKFGQKLQASGQMAQRTSYYFAAATAPLLMSLRSAFFSYARLDQETRRLTKLIADEFGTGAEAIEQASDKVRILGFELDKITAKYGTSRVLVQSLAGDFAELGVPDTAIVRLTEFTAAVEKLGNLDITQSQNFIQSIYQNILRVRRDMAAAEGYSLDLSSPKMMGQILSEVQGQLALFNMVENKTTLSLKDLADAFPEVSAAATTFGLSMTETAAMLAPMVAAGFQVGASANSIKVSLQRMVAMTKQNTQIIAGLNQALGDDFTYAAGVGMENIQQLVDGFNNLLSIKGEQGTLEFFARLFGVRQGPRMETSIRQLAVFQKALDNTSTVEGKIAAQLESSINARLTSHGYEAVSVKKIVDLANVHRKATQEVNGEYTIQARLVQQGQKDADAALRGAYTDTADYLSKVGTEAGKIFFTEAVGGVAAASIQMEQELGLAVDSVAVKFNKLKEAMLQIGRALAPIVDKVISAILPVIQGIGDFLKRLSPFTQKIMGFLAFTLILIPQIRLLAATFKMAFGGIIGSLGKMMNAADGLGASLKGVRATSVSLAQILENPNITKGYNKLTQITDSQFLLQQDKNAPGYSNRLLGRRKMRPLDDSGLSQPVKELFANKGVVGPADKTSIKTLLGKSTKLGLPNTDELIRSMLTDMGTIPEKIAESTAKATEKAATSTADKITKGLKNSVFQNNTFIGNKFGGGTAGPGGTGAGPRTPKTPTTGGTPTVPRTAVPMPATPSAPAAPSRYLTDPRFDQASTRRISIPSAKDMGKAATIGAPIAASVERVAAEAQAQVEALGGIVQKEIAKANEVIGNSVKPKANATRGSPKKVKQTLEKVVGEFASATVAPVEQVVGVVANSSQEAAEVIENTANNVKNAAKSATGGAAKAAKAAASGGGAGKIVSLSFKEMADVFQKAGVAIPDEWAFIKHIDREFQVAQGQKKAFLQKLQEQIALSPQNPFGEFDANPTVQKRKFFPFRSAYEKSQKSRPSDVLSGRHATKLPIFEGLFEEQLKDQGRSLPGPEKSLRQNLLRKLNDQKNKLAAGGIRAQAESRVAAQAYQDMIAAKRASEYAALDSIKGAVIPQGVENVLVSSSQEYITELENQVKAGRANLSRLEQSRSNLRRVGGEKAKRAREVLDSAIEAQKIEIATARDMLEYNSYNRFEKIIPATKTDTAMLMAQTQEGLASQSGIQNFARNKEDYSRLFKSHIESIPVQGMDGKARALYELALTKEAKKIASSMDQTTAQAITDRMKNSKYDLTRLEAARELARESLNMDVYNPMSQAYNPAAQADLINTKGLTADAKKAFLAAGGTEAEGTALGKHFTEMRKELSAAATAARAKSAADFAVVRAEYIAAEEAMRFPKPPAAQPKGAQSRGMFGMARGLMGPGGAYFADAGGAVKNAVASATQTYRDLINQTVDNIVNKLPASMGAVRKDLLKAVSAEVLRIQPLGAGKNAEKVAQLLDMSVIPETQGRVVAALAAVENQVVQDFGKAVNEGWTYAASETAKVGKKTANNSIGFWQKSLGLFAKNGDKLAQTLQGVIYDTMTAASVGLNDLEDQISSGGFTKAKLKAKLVGDDGLLSRVTRQRTGERGLLKPIIRPAEEAPSAEVPEKENNTRSKKQNTKAVNIDTAATEGNIASTEANTAATNENTVATEIETEAKKQQVVVEETSTAATGENTAAKQALTAATGKETAALTVDEQITKALGKTKVAQIAKLESQIATMTAEQLASANGVKVQAAQKDLKTKLNTLVKAQTEAAAAQANAEELGRASTSRLKTAKDKLASATQNAKIATDRLAKAVATAVTDVAATAPALAGAASSAASGTGASSVGTPKAPKTPRPRTPASAIPASATTGSAIVKAIEKQTLQFDSSLANFFKGPNFFQGPNIFQGKLISADKLNLKIKDSAKVAKDAAKALPATDPLVVQAKARQNYKALKDRIETRTGVPLSDERLDRLKRLTGVKAPTKIPAVMEDARAARAATRAADIRARVLSSVAASRAATASSGAKAAFKGMDMSSLDKVKSKLSSFNKMITGSIAGGFNKGFSLAGNGLTRFAQLYVKTMLSTVASGTDMSMKVAKSMTYLLSGGRKIIDETGLLGRAFKTLAVINRMSMNSIKTSAVETAFVMRALGTVVKSEVAPAFSQMIASLRNSKIIKAWTFLLFTGMNKVTGALRAASAAAGLFTSHTTRMKAVGAALDAISKKRVAAGLSEAIPMYQQLIIKAMAYTGVGRGLRAVFASLTKTMFAALTIAIKLNFAMLLIAPVFILIAGLMMSMKSGLVKNNAAVENFKNAWIAIREAIITLSKPLMEMIGKFGGLGKATNGANAASGAMHTLSRLVKYVADAFSRFAKGPGMRYMQEVIVPVLTRMINRFILLGRTIAGVFRGDASAIKNFKGLLLSLAYEAFNSLQKLFGFLANLLPKLGPLLSSMIEAVLNATIDAFMYIMNFGKEIALFFGSLLVGIGGALAFFTGGTSLLVSGIGAGLIAAAGAAHLLDKNIGRVKSGVKGVSTAIGTNIAQGLGKGAGFIEENIFGKIKKAIARKYGEEIGADVNAALASQLSDPADVKKALNDTLGGVGKNAPGAQAAGEGLGQAIAKGIKDKLISLKEDWTGSFFGKADDQIGKITENYKEAIDKQKEEAMKAFDTQISAIEALGKAEEELTAKMDYEEKRREMIRSRSLDKENYLRERKVAKYEGRTEDVRSLDLSFRKSDQAAGKDITNLDTERAKTLQEQQRSIAIAVINREKDIMAQSFDEMQKQFDINLEKILNKGFSTKEEFSALLGEIGGAVQGFSGELNKTFEAAMTSLPSAIRNSTDPAVGMFSMTMQKLVDQAKISFGAEVRTGDASSILGSAYAMANGMPDAFKQAFSDGVVSESVTPFIAKISTIMGGLNVDAIWIEAGRSATEAMIGEMKRKLRALKGDLYDEFKNLFAGMSAEYNQLFPTLEKLAKEIARIEAIRSQSGGGGGDSSSQASGSGYDSLGKEVISVKYGEHLARKPVEDISSAMDPKKFSFFGMLAEGAKNLAKALGPVKTAILGAVGAIAGFFVLKGVFVIIAKAFTILMTVGAKLLTPVAAVAAGITATGLAIAAAIGVVIGIIIYMYIKFKWFRDMVNDTFKSVIDFFVTGFQMLKEPVSGFLSAVFDGVKQILSSLFGPIIDFGKKVVMGIVGAIAGVVVVIVGALRGITMVFDFIKVPLFKFIGFIIDMASGIVSVLADIISGAIDFIYKIIGALFTVGIGGPIKLIIGAFKLAFDIIVGIVKIAIDLIVKAFDFLKGPLSGPFEVGFGIIKGVFDKIKDIVSGVIDFIKGIFGGFNFGDVSGPIITPFKVSFEFVRDVFGKIFDIVKGVFEKIISFIAPVGITITNILLAPFKLLFDVFKAIANNPIVVFFARLVALLGLVAAIAATWTIKIVLESTWFVIKKVVGALIDLGKFIVGGLVDAFNIIKDVAVKAWDFIYEKVRGFIDWWNEEIGSLWLIFVAVFVIMYEGAKMLFDWMKDTFGPILAKVWDAFKDATSAVWDLMKQVGSWIGSVFTAAWDVLKKAASLFWDYLGLAITFAWDGMKTVASWIGTAFSVVWGVLKKAASFYWDYLNFIIPFFWEVMKKVASWIGTVFSKAWDVISVVATKAFEILGGAISFVWETITGGWSTIRPVLETIGNFVRDVVTNAWDVLVYSVKAFWDIIKFGWSVTKPALDGLWGVIKGIISPAVGLLSQAFGFLWDGIKAAWGFVEPIFSAMVEIISNVLGPVVEFLGSVFQGIWNGIMAGWELIRPVFDWIADIVGNVIGVYVELLKTAFGLLWDGIVAGWGLVGPIFGWIGDIIGTVIKGAIDIVMFLWDNFWNGIKISWSFLKPIFDFIVDAIKTGIGFAIDLVKKGWDIFVAVLKNTKDFIVGIIQTIGNWIRDGIQFVIEKVISVWNGLKDAFSAVWSFIQPIISKIGDMIKNVIGGAIDFIKAAIEAIPQAFKLVVNSIGGLFNRAVDLLGGFAFPKTILGVPLPFIGGKKVSDFIPLPKIPTLYSGGKVGMYMKGGIAYGAGGMTYGPAQQGIPAVLHGGEYVINHKAVQRIGTDALDRLNSLRLSKPNLPTMPSVPSIKMPNAGMNVSSAGQASSSSTQNVNIYVDNFIGEPEWFNSMMKGYNTTVLPRNQKAAGLESRVINTYNGLNRGL
jgi:phage-related protein